MSYIEHVLQPGEEIRYQGSVHWILYLPAIILCVVGAVSMAFGPPGWVITAISISLAILLALRAWFIRWMTEIVVTDRRVIYAHGFIQRHSVEVHMDKIESVDVDQGMLGRVFDYGERDYSRDWHNDGALARRGSPHRLSQRGYRAIAAKPLCSLERATLPNSFL